MLEGPHRSGGFRWKGRAQPPDLVGQPSDYLASVSVHRRSPRLARVQCGLLVYTERFPHEGGVVTLPFLRPCSTLTPTQQRLILARSPVNLDLFRYFSGGGLSHRVRTNLSSTVAPTASCPQELNVMGPPPPILNARLQPSHGACQRNLKKAIGVEKSWRTVARKMGKQ